MKRTLVIVLAILGAIIFSIAMVRFATPEDTWIKDKHGQWVRHGNPRGGPPTR